MNQVQQTTHTIKLDDPQLISFFYKARQWLEGQRAGTAVMADRVKGNA